MVQYDCGYCQKSGHNKAGCPERKKELANRESMRVDRYNQIIASHEKHAARLESLEREIEMLWNHIHHGDTTLVEMIADRVLDAVLDDPPEKPGKQKVMLDF